MIPENRSKSNLHENLALVRQSAHAHALVLPNQHSNTTEIRQTHSQVQQNDGPGHRKHAENKLGNIHTYSENSTTVAANSQLGVVETAPLTMELPGTQLI